MMWLIQTRMSAIAEKVAFFPDWLSPVSQTSEGLSIWFGSSSVYIRPVQSVILFAALLILGLAIPMHCGKERKSSPALALLSWLVSVLIGAATVAASLAVYRSDITLAILVVTLVVLIPGGVITIARYKHQSG